MEEIKKNEEGKKETFYLQWWASPQRASLLFCSEVEGRSRGCFGLFGHGSSKHNRGPDHHPPWWDQYTHYLFRLAVTFSQFKRTSLQYLQVACIEVSLVFVTGFVSSMSVLNHRVHQLLEDLVCLLIASNATNSHDEGVACMQWQWEVSERRLDRK